MTSHTHWPACVFFQRSLLLRVGSEAPANHFSGISHTHTADGQWTSPNRTDPKEGGQKGADKVGPVESWESSVFLESDLLKVEGIFVEEFSTFWSSQKILEFSPPCSLPVLMVLMMYKVSHQSWSPGIWFRSLLYAGSCICCHKQIDRTVLCLIV